MNSIASGLILLTYKGKVLLMHKQKSVIDEENHPWCLIGGIREKKESFEKALSRRVQKEAGIKIDNVQVLSEFCYHAELTDDNVNKIQRKEFQLLDFFAPREIGKLFLSSSTQAFIAKHASLISPIASLTYSS
ncbi:MAG TPA: NUDIX domain-containing protein [Patescibacteria group bacterium]|nr:NUDIX domain-containing protein [Patescibacteria group bacterium]